MPSVLRKDSGHRPAPQPLQGLQCDPAERQETQALNRA